MSTTEVEVTMLVIRVFGRPVSVHVLGGPDDYGRDVTVRYPLIVGEPPSEANGWVSQEVRTASWGKLKEAFSFMGPWYLTRLKQAYDDREHNFTLSCEAWHIPSCGNVSVQTEPTLVQVPSKPTEPPPCSRA